jgi:tetratricopeptide (TPR) repeat protein
LPKGHGEFEPAAGIIIDVTELLDRWELGRLMESLNQQLIPEVKKETQAVLSHNLGILLQNRGDYQAAIHQYEKSLKIKEELGNRAGVASSLHQIGRIHHEREEYQEALEMYIKSLTIFAELQSPDASTTIENLIELRTQWGAEHFDAAWMEKTGEGVPEFLKESGGE